MSLCHVGFIAVICTAHVAHAERPIAIEIERDAPFDADQLAAAIRMRLPRDGSEVRVRIVPIAGGVRVATGGGERDVELAGLQGPVAARLVALAANDLLLADLATVPAAVARRVEPVDSPAKLDLAVLGTAARWDGALGTIGIDAARSWGPWLAAAELGGGSLVDGPVQLRTAVARISGGLRWSWVELRAGVVIEPLIVHSGDGDRTVLVGAGTSARVRLGRALGVHPVVAIGVDAFATRTEYRVSGMTVMATPAVSPWLAAGLEVSR